ncbi:putative F-box protein At5g44220 [Capsella rubella]|uniref:putative F-box protein At5g44220 n=1 Tax=Capsella rubella TaxID=81985 RepID=UPI000CD4CF8A|nr:putative F-box protein At5g44220 [Capsella rubella]
MKPEESVDNSRVETSHDAMVESTTSISSPARVRKKSNKILDDQTTISDLLPSDILMDILKLLPAKTLVRFLSVSKLWSSILRRQDFKKLFLTESSKQPQRLFFIPSQDEDKVKDCVLFSLETHDSGEALIAALHHKTNLAYPYTNNTSHVRDLVCFGTNFASDELVVHNTSTRRSITLPKLDSQSFYVVKQFLSYDPIDDVYKVLCMTRRRVTAEGSETFQVLTLGNENSWRMIEGAWHTYTPTSYGICIDGVLYYQVSTDKETRYSISFVSFDVKSEQFNLINRPGDGGYLGLTIMMRYEGKLGIISTYMNIKDSLVFWVLEDAMKHEWLKKVIDFTDPWPLHQKYRFVDFNDDAGEFVLAPCSWCEPPYYVYYYDPKTNILRKVPITGYERQPNFPTYLFTRQVESLMFL